jgi:large subunit ribosomal protein L15
MRTDFIPKYSHYSPTNQFQTKTDLPKKNTTPSHSPPMFAARSTATKGMQSLYTTSTRNITMALHNLRPNPGSRIQWRKKGRGRSSGLGKTSGRGQKGYYARSGASGLIWYEGGQSQLWRKTPKYGFKNINRKPLNVINISRVVNYIAMGRIDPTKKIDMKVLSDSGAVTGKIRNGVKLLAKNNKYIERLGMPLNIEVTHSSRFARDAVRRLGGDVKFQWYSKLGLRHLLKPGSLGHFVPGPSVPPPRLTLRYEHQFCGKDDLIKLEELRKARIVRKIKKRV